MYPKLHQCGRHCSTKGRGLRTLYEPFTAAMKVSK